MPDIVKKVTQGSLPYHITVGGKAGAILVNKDEYDAILETAQILADKPLMRRIRASKKRMRAGDYVTLESILETL